MAATSEDTYSWCIPKQPKSHRCLRGTYSCAQVRSCLCHLESQTLSWGHVSHRQSIGSQLPCLPPSLPSRMNSPLSTTARSPQFAYLDSIALPIGEARQGPLRKKRRACSCHLPWRKIMSCSWASQPLLGRPWDGSWCQHESVVCTVSIPAVWSFPDAATRLAESHVREKSAFYSWSNSSFPQWEWKSKRNFDSSDLYSLVSWERSLMASAAISSPALLIFPAASIAQACSRRESLIQRR